MIDSQLRASIEESFALSIDIPSIKRLEHPLTRDTSVVTFQALNGVCYLLKPVPLAALARLEVVFTQLEPLRHSAPVISLPLASRDGRYHLISQEGVPYQLLVQLPLSPIDTNALALETLLDEVAQLHQNLAHCNIPPSHYSDLRAYVLYGIQRIEHRYGPQLPFLSQLRRFINQFPIARLQQGVRHGDVQATNVYLWGEKLMFLDFDTAHFGYPLLDLVQATAIYVSWDAWQDIPGSNLVPTLHRHVVDEYPGIDEIDLLFLLGRVLLGPIQGGDVQLTRAELTQKLQILEELCQEAAT